MTKSSSIALVLPLFSLLGCGGTEGRESFGSDSGQTFNGSASASASAGDGIETSDSSSTDPTSDTDPSDSNDDGLKLDTINTEEGQTTADDGGGSEGCKAIDFLFVIDNSGSMGDNQQNLIASFPGFIDKIQQTIADVDSYHIMVAKTDQYWNDCQIECAFFPFLCQFGDVNACNGAPSVCDETLGAGVNFPIGDDASNKYCDLTGGQRFITPQEPLDELAQKFTCIASVGTDGDSGEMPMSSLTQAIGPALNGPGGCNSGFLRDDAVLVITIITDEEDSDSQGNPQGWFQNIVAQKAGDGSGVVVLGLINDTDAGNPVCPVDSQDPAKIREFIQMFPNHIEGSVCEANYAPFFEQAVDLINTTCDEYVPVG
ncbi:hypothetical protein [Enhygromyxa salina]|uniref:VWFA domain-containing protein n=1 Tax=Enhygromyxa salina TaxID=215803 RepID=A0A2S9XX02_9BACT|nr:hypothetical protein [Enhygromyxa salina]PRP97382.1 hypothetical protein ENSA7_67320 [Enhygromyxa salina]